MWVIFGIIGFFIGGPIGAVIGVVIGLGISGAMEDGKVSEQVESAHKATNSGAQHSRNEGTLIEKLYPCVDILCSYALMFEPTWTSAKVRYIKDVFESECTSAHEKNLLKERIKLASRPSLKNAISSYLNLQPNEDSLRSMHYFVLGLLAADAWSEAKFEELSIGFGTDIGLSYNYCKSKLKEFRGASEEHSSYKSNHSSQSVDRSKTEWACEVLGISGEITEDRVKKAFRTKIHQFHPDKNGDVTDAVRDMLNQKANEVNEARDFLLKLC